MYFHFNLGEGEAKLEHPERKKTTTSWELNGITFVLKRLNVHGPLVGIEPPTLQTAESVKTSGQQSHVQAAQLTWAHTHHPQTVDEVTEEILQELEEHPHMLLVSDVDALLVAPTLPLFPLHCCLRHLASPWLLCCVRFTILVLLCCMRFTILVLLCCGLSIALVLLLCCMRFIVLVVLRCMHFIVLLLLCCVRFVALLLLLLTLHATVTASLV